MSKAFRDLAALGLGGAVIGVLLGTLAAGVYVTWVAGGDVANVGFGAIFTYAPWEVGAVREPFRTGAVVGAAVAIALTLAVPVIAFRPELTSHGSARWATAIELRRAGLTKGIRGVRGPIYAKLGKPRSRAAYLTSAEIPHSLIAAPTGSGKGVGVVIPTLLTYPGSVLCLDVKGENFAATARHRKAIGDRVYKFAPYDPEGRTHRYNPLEDVAAAPERRRYTEARRLAASLIVAQGNGQGFLGGARDLFAAAALLVIERGTPTIAAIYDALSEPGEAFETLRKLGDAAKAQEAKTIFHQMAGMESRVLSSYMSVLIDGGLGLWNDPAVRDATECSDFDGHDLRRSPASIYIVVAPNDLVPLAPLIRLLFQQTVAVLQRAEPDRAAGEDFPVLFLLDEFVSLGRMEVLASAITTLRSYGGRVMIVVQTIASLRDLYGKDGASTFLANCRLQLFMAPADEETPEYVSRAIGDFTRKERSKSWRGYEFATSYQERVEGARLIRPEQVRMLRQDRVVALVQNMHAVTARRVTYYEDRELRRIFEGQSGELPEPSVRTELAGTLPEGASGTDAPSTPAGETSRGEEKAEAVVEYSKKDEGRLDAQPRGASRKAMSAEMDQETEQGIYASLSHLAVDQDLALDGIATELEEAKRRNRVRACHDRSEPQQAGKTSADGQPSEILDVLASAREANRDRSEA